MAEVRAEVSRPTRMHRAPVLARSDAMAKPIPRDAPVIMATLPSNAAEALDSRAGPPSSARIGGVMVTCPAEVDRETSDASVT